MVFDLFDQAANHILGTATYAEFKARLLASSCQRCPLGRTRKNIVVDRGNPASSILVIGEGPGREEDAQGKAFVGRSGQLLDRILASIGLDSNRDVLIANVVKCRATTEEGENRPPLPAEAETCMPYLKHQIELMRPKVILLLGATSLRHMDSSRKDFAMGKEAGKFFRLADYPGTELMVLYHPAALLRTPSLKADTWRHVKALKARLEELGVPVGSAPARPAQASQGF